MIKHDLKMASKLAKRKYIYYQDQVYEANDAE